MNQDEFARRIFALLNRHLNELPATVTDRLAEVRKRALQQPRTTRQLSVTIADWAAGHRMMLRLAVPVLFVIIAASAIIFNQTSPEHDPFDLETALIGDELPIHAYTDPGFDTWLRHSSHEEQQ